MSRATPKLLSVIVPAYRQGHSIYKDLSRLASVLEKLRYNFELICVVDGLVDDTLDKAISASKRHKAIKVVSYATNKGKGYAVRFGIAKSKGDIIAFIDAGMEIDPNGISMLLEHMEWYDADIIIGSKRHPASRINYPVERKVISRMYQLFVKLFAGLNVTDTQAGLKIYRRTVLEHVLPRLIVKRYAFDLEMLTVAHHLGFTRIYEAPIKLDYNFKDFTHAATFKSMLNIFIDTLAIIYRLRFKQFYSDSNKHNWRKEPELNFKTRQS